MQYVIYWSNSEKGKIAIKELYLDKDYIDAYIILLGFH